MKAFCCFSVDYQLSFRVVFFVFLWETLIEFAREWRQFTDICLPLRRRMSDPSSVLNEKLNSWTSCWHKRFYGTIWTLSQIINKVSLDLLTTTKKHKLMTAHNSFIFICRQNFEDDNYYKRRTLLSRPNWIEEMGKFFEMCFIFLYLVLTKLCSSLE